MAGNGSAGCLKWGGIGCLVVAIPLVIGGWYVVKNADRFMQKGGAALIEIGAQQIFQGFNLPPEERAAAMKPIKAVTAKMREGKITGEQAEKILEALMGGHVHDLLMMRAFTLHYVDKAGLAPEDRAEAVATASRYVQGLIDEQVDRETINAISDVLTVKTTNADGEQQDSFKPSLTADELKKCLAIMRDAADAAGVENREFTFDLAAEIQKAVDEGFKRAAEAAPAMP